MASEPIAVTLQVIGVLEQLGVDYLIGGSLASAVHGTARATLDADLVVTLRDEQVEALVAALSEQFYVDAAAAHAAIARQGSFNLIHYATMFKVDLFVAGSTPFDQAQFRNRQAIVVATDPERSAWVASAEDTILAKLAWYQAGGGQSARQWEDVRAIWRVQGARLDVSYLRQMADALAVGRLLRRLIDELGGAD